MRYILFTLKVIGILFGIFILLGACQRDYKPRPIKYGVHLCAHCKMTITDARFSSQLQTIKGKVYNFDDAQCMIHFVKNKDIEPEEVACFYLSDYLHQRLHASDSLLFLKSDELKSPMRGDIAAFQNLDELNKTQRSLGGTIMTWDELWK